MGHPTQSGRAGARGVAETTALGGERVPPVGETRAVQEASSDPGDGRAAIARAPGGVRTTRRRGRTSAWKERVLADLGPRWMLPADGPWDPTSLADAFGGPRPLLVDVGVGDGAATRAWAEGLPDASVLALELHRPGLAKLVAALDADGPPNVRVAEADALEVLAAMADGSLAGIRALFPDPWPKRRHVARRLVDRAFAVRVADLLVPGGTLELATDWADYADHMRSMVSAEPRLVADHPTSRPARPETTYERRGLRAGRTVTDLRWRRAEAD